MPESGAQPVPDQDMMDVGNGIRATLYTDGSVVFWREDTREQVGYLPPGGENPVDLQDGRAAVLQPDGSLLAYDITNPPPEFAGTIPTGAAPGEVPAPPTVARPGQPTGEVGTRRPGEDFNYGISRPGAGVYPGASAYPNQRTPGRPTDIPFGQTVAPSTWNPADPSQGRGEGWGTIGAGTAGVPFGWGVPGFGQNPIPIREEYLDNLFDPKQAPGYLGGSGTFNQYRLDQPGLFGSIPGQTGEVNLRHGLGGTGDPTTGREIQTPMRWVTGNASDPITAELNDDAWRRRTGQLAGGGGYDPAQAVAVVPPYQYPPSEGAAVPYGTGGGGGTGGGFFGAGPGYSPAEQGSLWGKGATAGMDYLITNFMRSDTPTGVSTSAWSAPQQMWDGLVAAIRSGQVVVTDPQGWAMLKQKNPMYTPQNIGGAALTGASGASASGAGAGGQTEDAIANGNAAAAADRAAYWAYQQAMIRQGDSRIAMEAARDAWTKAYQEAGLTGTLGGQATLDRQKMEAGLTGMYQGAPTFEREQFAFNQEMQKVANELAAAGLLGTYQGQQTLAAKAQEFSQRLAQQQFGLSEAGVTGSYNGAPTFAARQHQDQTAMNLMQLQASLSGPRNWDKYQSTFNATPGGFRDVMAAFQGRYALPGAAGAQATAQGGRASVAGLSGDILSGTYGADGTQQPEAVGNPYQADVRNWSRMMPSQREMILGKAENQGWMGDDFQQMLNSAAPKYAGAAGGSYSLFK